LKVAVTGAAGFIGSHLVPGLLFAGHGVTAVMEPGTNPQCGNVRLAFADITTGEELPGSFSDVDAVVHLAARNHVLKEPEKDPLSAYRRVNVEGTRNVIRAAAKAGARWFIHFSSVKAMGEGGEVVFDEDSPCKPSTPYGISKLESEEVVRRVAEESGIGAVIFRLPMVYGSGNLGNLPRMIRWADKGLPFPLFHPENLRSMVYVENVVHAVPLAIQKAPQGVSTYILKDMEDYSTRIVYSAICNALGKKPRFLPVPSPVVRLGGLLSEDFRKIAGSFRVNSAKFVRDTNFAPPFSLDEGITRTVQWYKRSAR
jgi:nucleoside-diphosphate-sugar epimerase